MDKILSKGTIEKLGSLQNTVMTNKVAYHTVLENLKKTNDNRFRYQRIF